MEKQPAVVVLAADPGGGQQQRGKGTGKLVAAVVLVAVALGLGIGLGVGLKSGTTTTSTSPAPTVTLYSVSSSLTLAGLTSGTFTTAARSGFASSMASSLGVAPTAVAVTSVTDITTARRRVLATGIAVNFTVASTTASTQSTVAQGITSLSTSAAALSTFTSSLNTALAAAGAPTVTSVGAPSLPVLATVSSQPLPPPPPSPSVAPPPASTPSPTTPSPSPSTTPSPASTPSPTQPPTQTPTPTPTPSSGSSGIVFNINTALGIAIPGQAPPPAAPGRRHLLQGAQCCSANNVGGCSLNSTCPTAPCPGNATVVACASLQTVGAACPCSPQSPGQAPGNGSSPAPTPGGSPQAPNAPASLASAPVVALSSNASLSSAVTQSAGDASNQVGTISQVYTYPPLNLSVYAVWTGATTATKINGSTCLLFMVNKTSGAPSCLHTPAVTSLMRRNTNGGQNPGFGDDVQFDVAGNVYYVGTYNGSEALFRVNALAGNLTPTALAGRNPQGDTSKWAVVASGPLNGTYIVGGCPYIIPVVNNMPASPNASCGTRAFTPAQTLLYRIAAESFQWSVVNNDGNFYMGYIPNGGCEAAGCNPPPGVYQYVPGGSGLTPTAMLASSITNGGQCTSATCNSTFSCACVGSLYPTGASPLTPATPNTTIQAACPLCDKLSSAFGQGIAKLGNGAIITALPYQVASLPSPNAYGYSAPTNVSAVVAYNTQFGAVQTLFQYYPLPGRELNGAAQNGGLFQNMSVLTSLVNDTMACAGQAVNGTWFTTLFNLTANAHTVIPAASSVKVASLSYSASANSLFVSGTKVTGNSTSVVLLIVPLSNLSNATAANTTGFSFPFSSLATF